MSKLPRQLSYRKVIAPCAGRGSVFIGNAAATLSLVRDEPYAQVVVPAHRALATGTLGDILGGADLTLEQFIELL